MKIFVPFVIVLISLCFFVSCGGEDSGGSIYDNTKNDTAGEEPDDEIQDYQTMPDTNDPEEVNNDMISHTGEDEDITDEENDADIETDITEGMVVIPQGQAWIGCNENVEEDCPADELPYFEASMRAYFIDKYEVTVSDYLKCINAGACGAQGDTYETVSFSGYCNLGASGKEEHPMNCVNWKGAHDYCVWAGKRLPSEGEWEKAARGGCEIYEEKKCAIESYIYTWGNEGAPDCDKVNMASSDTSWGCGTDSTAVGGSYPASDSPYGVSDMLGNLFEWVADKWEDTHDDAKPDGSSTGIPETQGVIKGGGFIQTDVSQFRISYRSSESVDNIFYSRGFRCAADIK